MRRAVLGLATLLAACATERAYEGPAQPAGEQIGRAHV